MHRRFVRIKYYLNIFWINFLCKIYSSNCKKRVALVSCSRWKNKVIEDVKLKYYLTKLGVKADIISFQEKMNIDKYDAFVIRSVWGFSEQEFKNWLELIKSKDKKVFNSIDLIKNNYSKKDQFDILDKYNIGHIPTKYLKNNFSLKQELDGMLADNSNIVVKPHISESGRDTYIIPSIPNVKNSISLNEFLDKEIKSDILLVQPFYSEIKDGEISVIVIDKKISHAVKRFPGVFDTHKQSVEIPMDMLNKEIIDLANKITNIKEYDEQLYLRIDFIKVGSEYLVLEVELIDPMLYFNIIKNNIQRKKAYFNFSKRIKERL